jgi:hypothetical protein
MDAKMMTRLRPIDTSAAAIRTALAMVEAERAATQQRLDEQIARRSGLLLTGTNGEIRSAEEAVRDAELDLVRLPLMADALKQQLAEAAAREAGDVRAQRVREAEAKVIAFNEWFATNYAAHAAAIQQGLELEQAATFAINALRDPNTRALDVALPAMSRAFVGSDARGLGFLVRLPATEPGGECPWWPR